MNEWGSMLVQVWAPTYFVLLYVIVWILLILIDVLDMEIGSYSHHDPQITYSWFFLLQSSQGIGVSGCIDYTYADLVDSLHIACNSMDTTLLGRVHSSIS
ncbi:hypothetical protein TNCV_3256681 [Trichonephila clavipes]|nr:hypothetical protein TNCV_3256681 [Trichonephila clavipes]